MTLTNIIMIVGVASILLSFFIKDRTKKLEKDIEDLSINIYQETNTLKRRLKVVEEELLLDAPLKMQSAPSPSLQHHQPAASKSNVKQSAKPINGILVSQVLALSKQGLSIDEIEKRSALTKDQIVHILRTGGQA